jgi:hypothetical protein
MVAVGYGREAEDGSQTLGGRSVDELSANITTISQELNTDATTIKHVSLGKFVKTIVCFGFAVFVFPCTYTCA